MLEALLPLFSSRLIRNRATLGGNLATASPIGDSPPVLLALGAEVILASAEGERTVPVSELFTGYRKTALKDGEVIAKVRIPRPFPTIGRFYKVSKRVHDDISTVAAGFAIDLDDAGVVKQARLAYGGVAATPARASDAEKALVGKKWSAEAVADAKGQAAPAKLSKIVKLSEARAIMDTLESVGGHRANAARALGISERTLRYRLASFREAGIAMGAAR